jgi:CheY-like chemotaxis protein
MKQSGVAILLVEDDPDMAEMFSLGLSFAGDDVEVSGDGGAAFGLTELTRWVSARTHGGGEVTPETSDALAAAPSRELSNKNFGG